jgi:hypothetical protein
MHDFNRVRCEWTTLVDVCKGENGSICNIKQQLQLVLFHFSLKYLYMYLVLFYNTVFHLALLFTSNDKAR